MYAYQVIFLIHLFFRKAQNRFFIIRSRVLPCRIFFLVLLPKYLLPLQAPEEQPRLPPPVRDNHVNQNNKYQERGSFRET